MLLRKTAWLALGFFLVTFSATGSVAQAQAPLKVSKAAELSTKKWEVIDGFRSAKFGMDGKQVLRAIAKDFKISKSRVERKVHPVAGTTALILHLPRLMDIGGPANIVYILGYKSKTLVQINILWGEGVTKKFDQQDVTNAAKLLRKHFVKKRYKKDGYLLNWKLEDGTIVMFRGKDKKDRMISLLMPSSKVKKGKDKIGASKYVSLKLSYILDVDKPDIQEITKGKF
jgi:hypothetical protein